MIKPILFNTEMTRAILDGRKTATRRVIKPQPTAMWKMAGPAKLQLLAESAPYHPGDILWVRETWCPFDSDHIIDGQKYAYRADCTDLSEDIRKAYGYPWHSSIHMPKAAARLFLRVTSVKAERLQDITPDGIDAEGCKEYAYSAATGKLLPSSPIWFKITWDNTLKKPALPTYGWDANPWVFAIEFERCEKPANWPEKEESEWA